MLDGIRRMEPFGPVVLDLDLSQGAQRLVMVSMPRVRTSILSTAE